MQYLIVGLGNYGDEYKLNRHNTGFLFIDRLLNDGDFKYIKKHHNRNAIIYENKYAGKSVFLMKPLTMVNNSGLAVKDFVVNNSLTLDNLLVVYDDYYLYLGVIRLRKSGSSGGHNGVSSIIECLATENFPRLRIGIGPCVGEPVDFVLSDFTKDELNVLEESLKVSVEATKFFIDFGFDKAMGKYNKKNIALRKEISYDGKEGKSI